MEGKRNWRAQRVTVITGAEEASFFYLPTFVSRVLIPVVGEILGRMIITISEEQLEKMCELYNTKVINEHLEEKFQEGTHAEIQDALKQIKKDALPNGVAYYHFYEKQT